MWCTNIADEANPYDWNYAQKELTETAMNSLTPIVEDEKTKKEKEEAERKLRELEDSVSACWTIPVSCSTPCSMC